MAATSAATGMLKGNVFISYEGGKQRSQQVPDVTPSNPASRFRRAVALSQQEAWPEAFRDFDDYIRWQPIGKGIKGNKTLANAFYGRALCHVKLNSRAQAVCDLHECIRVGPEDEQMTEDECSRVPAAHVALFALLTACPELEEEAAALKAAHESAALMASAQETDDADLACFEGKLWRAPLTQLDGAVKRACDAGKTPLLLDSTGTADVAFLYQHATVVEAKQLVLEVRSPARSLSDLKTARWGLRKKLVHAMRWGHTLVVRLSDTAPDFAYYCDAAHFPLAVFDHAALPAGTDAAADPVFKHVLRESDTADCGGHLFVPETFQVVLTSSFSADVYEEHLSRALPTLDSGVQPILLFELTDEMREAEGLVATSAPGEGGGPVLGMAEQMASTHWGGASAMQFGVGKGDVD